jgi:hypothetical protein
MHFLTVAAAASLATFVVFTSGARAQDTVGVESCDSFLKTYEACVASKVPAEQRGTMTAVLSQMKTNWKAVAATPEGKAQLDSTCKSTAETMKKQVAALNCAW